MVRGFLLAAAVPFCGPVRAGLGCGEVDQGVAQACNAARFTMCRLHA